jgi:hypothetical protein
MLRSYPFALVFLMARAIPAIERMGQRAFISAVWTVIRHRVLLALGPDRLPGRARGQGGARELTHRCLTVARR